MGLLGAVHFVGAAIGRLTLLDIYSDLLGSEQIFLGYELISFSHAGGKHTMDGFMTIIKYNHNQNNQKRTAVFTFFLPLKLYVFTRANYRMKVQLRRFCWVDADIGCWLLCWN